jgi:hypothetical protein
MKVKVGLPARANNCHILPPCRVAFGRFDYFSADFKMAGLNAWPKCIIEVWCISAEFNKLFCPAPQNSLYCAAPSGVERGHPRFFVYKPCKKDRDAIGDPDANAPAWLLSPMAVAFQ